MGVVVVGMAVVSLLNTVGLPLQSLISLSRSDVLRGQVWRLVTFIFVPPSTNTLWLLVSLYFYYMMGQMLEYNWGGFKLNVYYLCGILGTILAMLLSGMGSNVYLNLSLFLAFATLSPDTEFRLFFILPVKAKWMAAAYAVLMLLPLVLLNTPTRALQELVSLAFSLLNYILFFGPTLFSQLRNSVRIARNRRNWNNQNRR